MNINSNHISISIYYFILLQLYLVKFQLRLSFFPREISLLYDKWCIITPRKIDKLYFKINKIVIRNTLWGALHRAKRLTTNWEQDLQSVKKRFQHAGYPFNFIQKTIHEFENPKKPDTIIPVNWFDDRRTVTIRVPYGKANEQQSYAFIKKLERFTRGHYKFAIIWQTKKLTSMFRLKDNNIHPSHVVYHGTCADCSASYIGESCRNFETRKQEHEDATKQSEPARHLRENPYHHFKLASHRNRPPIGN